MNLNRKLKNYLVVFVSLLALIFISNLVAKQTSANPEKSAPDRKQLLAASAPAGDPVSCDPPLIKDSDGNCYDPYAGGGGGGDGPSVNPPTVVTGSASNIGQTSATLQGTITDNGGEDPGARGFGYGTNTNYDLSVDEVGSYPVGAFSDTVTGLSCGTTYHFQAYAANAAANAYGTDQTFTTTACAENPPPAGSTAPGTTSSGGPNNNPQVTSAAEPNNPPPVPPPNTPTLKPTPAETTSVLNQLLSTISSQTAGTKEITLEQLHQLRGISAVPRPDLQLGNVGKSVQQLQIFLNRHGFPLASTGPGSLNQETNIFGTLTENSLKLFQKAHNLPATGFYSHLTWSVMFDIENGQ